MGLEYNPTYIGHWFCIEYTVLINLIPLKSNLCVFHEYSNFPIYKLWLVQGIWGVWIFSIMQAFSKAIKKQCGPDHGGFGTLDSWSICTESAAQAQVSI